MSLVSLEQKITDLRRCDQSGCNRWWYKTDFKTVAKDTPDVFLKCPYCREAKPKPTQYWHGDLIGPREPSYDYPAKMPPTPHMHPLPLNPSGSRQSSTKRQMSGDLLANTPTQNKKLKQYQQQTQWLTSDQATPATTPTASIAETARMVRKDSIQSAASPITAKVVPSPETPLAHFERHLEEWQVCKGRSETFMQKELKVAEENLESLQKNIPKIERKVQDFQKQLAEAQEELERMEKFQKGMDALAAEALVDKGKHKTIREEWKPFPMKHVQLAWAENNRCSEAWQKAVNDRATAQKCETEIKQKIEKILEERKELETFGRLYMSSLPPSNGA
ncbi:hypothetical protein E4T44_03971 [Aureobasidium sp. EXF-8845]|nr:hypothetical protein E4T44_03971 [Aureobasidium sp. EXF-8845]KAI4854826.1 hypothetical protein E4T45_03745 [Aureobasidium sp. EXF-8846]